MTARLSCVPHKTFLTSNDLGIPEAETGLDCDEFSGEVLCSIFS